MHLWEHRAQKEFKLYHLYTIIPVVRISSR